MDVRCVGNFVGVRLGIRDSVLRIGECHRAEQAVEMAVKKGASAAAKKRVLAVRKGATWGK